jgi:hypothetical protein
MHNQFSMNQIFLPNFSNRIEFRVRFKFESFTVIKLFLNLAIEKNNL